MSDGVFTHYNPADGNPADYSSPDIIERAEAVLKWTTRTGATYRTLAKFVPELVAELKAARAENEQLRSTWTPPEDATRPPQHNSAAKDCVQHPPKTPGTGVCSICSTYDNATWLTQREMIYGDD